MISNETKLFLDSVVEEAELSWEKTRIYPSWSASVGGTSSYWRGLDQSP